MCCLFNRNGTYYGQWFDIQRRPNQRRISLFTRDEQEALTRLHDLENQRINGTFNPWKSNLRIDKFQIVERGGRNGFVYLIRCTTTGLVKIGRAKNPLTRFAAIQAAAPTRLELLATRGAKDSLLLESKLHHTFSEFRLNGEWFNIPKDELDYLLTRFTQQPDRP